MFQSKTEFLSKCRKVKAADWNEKSEVPVRNKQNLWSLLDSSTNARGVSRNLVGRGETGVLYGSHQHARSQPTFAISMQICISVAHLSPSPLHSNASIHPKSIVASGISTSSHPPIGLPDTTAGSSAALLLHRFTGANHRKEAKSALLPESINVLEDHSNCAPRGSAVFPTR